MPTARLLEIAHEVSATLPRDARSPWLQYNAELIGILNSIATHQEETRSMIDAIHSKLTISIASGFREYAAGEEASAAAADAALRADIGRLADEVQAMRVASEAALQALRRDIEQQFTGLLGTMARMSDRQSRIDHRRGGHDAP